MPSLSLFLTPALLIGRSLGQVVGTATGFATGVTGGGDATPAAPSDITELTSWLTDDEARVILIDKEFNFIGSEGTTTAEGCRPASNTCPGHGGQDAIDAANWCSSDYPVVNVTYDNAAIEGINVKSNKSIVGVGSSGVLRGKGLRIANGATNVIIQNIHITELNPQYIWGGDAITLVGTDMIWIDHCKFSLIGRQFLVTGYDPAGNVTITNNELDGETSWSASCNNEHYWTMLFYGEDDRVTFANNYIHHTSGRSPKIGADDGTVLFHAVNNYWADVGGHAFDVGAGATVLIEGNVLDNVTTPITTDTATAGGALFNVPDDDAAAQCADLLGRDCLPNAVTDSGDFPAYTDAAVLTAFGAAGTSLLVAAADADTVAASVVANAGVGKLSSSSSSSSASSAVSATSTPTVAANVNEVVASSPAVVASSASPVASSAVVVAASSASPVAATPTSAAPVKVASSSAAPVIVASSSASLPSASASAGSSSSSSSGTIAEYYQCGGDGWTGSGSCAAGLTCKEWNEWYSQCVQE